MTKPLLLKLNLLNKLHKDTKPVWGKMTAQHMVEHLIYSFKMSTGEIKVECFNEPAKLPALKKYLMSSRPLPKDFVNPVIGPDVLPLEFISLQEAVLELEKRVNKYYDFFKNNPEALTINMTFGQLNKEEWDVFHEKHMTHHFSQFGLISKE